MSNFIHPNIPQMAVDCILAAIEEGDVRYVKPENVTIDKRPNADWDGEGFITIIEDVSKGTNHQHGIGPVRTPLAIKAHAETRNQADLLCKEATKAVLEGLTRLVRRGFGIHGVFTSSDRSEGKNNAKLHGGKRDETAAVRFLIVVNSINSI